MKNECEIVAICTAKKSKCEYAEIAKKECVFREKSISVGIFFCACKTAIVPKASDLVSSLLQVKA